MMKVILSMVFCLCVAAVIGQGYAVKRISRAKCEEYQQQIKNKNICNVKVPSIPHSDDPGSYPFLGLIGHDNENGDIDWTCSGSLISDEYILTTAHCIFNLRSRSIPKYIRFGETNLATPNSKAETYLVSEAIKHPSYKPPSAYNDIALLKLKNPVEFTESIRPICLYTGEDLPKYHMAGFSYRTRELEYRDGILLHQDIEVESNDKCTNEFPSSRKLKDGVNFTTQFCIKDAKYACELNSGAAIIHKDEDLDCMYNIVGVSGLGKGICLGKPEIDVKVSAFVDWIENVVWK